jgi:hypothetical protein
VARKTIPAPVSKTLFIGLWILIYFNPDPAFLVRSRFGLRPESETKSQSYRIHRGIFLSVPVPVPVPVLVPILQSVNKIYKQSADFFLNFLLFPNPWIRLRIHKIL